MTVEIDEVNEITYIKKYYNHFDSKISNFLNSDVLGQEIEQNFQQQIANKTRQSIQIRNNEFNKNHNKEDLDALKSLKNNIKENIKRENLLQTLKQNWKTRLKAKR